MASPKETQPTPEQETARWMETLGRLYGADLCQWIREQMGEELTITPVEEKTEIGKVSFWHKPDQDWNHLQVQGKEGRKMKVRGYSSVKKQDSNSRYEWGLQIDGENFPEDFYVGYASYLYYPTSQENPPVQDFQRVNVRIGNGALIELVRNTTELEAQSALVGSSSSKRIEEKRADFKSTINAIDLTPNPDQKRLTVSSKPNNLSYCGRPFSLTIPTGIAFQGRFLLLS